MPSMVRTSDSFERSSRNCRARRALLSSWVVRTRSVTYRVTLLIALLVRFVLGQQAVEALPGLGEDLPSPGHLPLGPRVGNLHHRGHHPEANLAQVCQRTGIVGHLPGRAVTRAAPFHLGLARVGELENSPPLDLLAGDQALVLQQLECGVDRTRAGSPTASAPLGELLHHLVSMLGPLGQEEEDAGPHVAAPDLRPSPVEEWTGKASGATH